MRRNLVTSAALATALLLGGCEFADNALLPSLSGSPPGGTSGATHAGSAGNAPAVASGVSSGLELGTGNFKPEPAKPLKQTGTPAGQQAVALGGELVKLQESLTQQNQRLQSLRAEALQHAQAYAQSVAAINAKLDAGTTPANPELLKQWNDAQAELQKGGGTLAAMNQLSAQVSTSASKSNSLLASIRAAAGLSGASDEDRAQLKTLEDETFNTSFLVERLYGELAEDINRETSYLGQQQANLNTLSAAINSGQPLGPSLASRGYAAASSLAPGSGIATGRPLVVIRFDKPNPDYQQPLYEAVSQVLARRPNAAFDLVGVATQGGGDAQAALDSNLAQLQADQVLRSLMSMGISPDRISKSAATSPTAKVNEVQLYVR